MVWDQISNAAKASSASGVKPVLTGTYSVNGWECRPSFQLLVDLAKAYPPQKASEITGIKAELIIKLAEKMVSDRPVSIMTHMGFTRTFYGDLSMRAVGTLAAVNR